MFLVALLALTGAALIWTLVDAFRDTPDSQEEGQE